MAERLRAGIRREVRRAVLVAVGMAIKASRAGARKLGLAILGHVVLLLCKGRQQQAQPLQLSGGKEAVELLEIIVEREQHASGDIAHLGVRSQVHPRRKLGQELIWQIEIQVEPRQVSPILELGRLTCGKGRNPCGQRF